MLIVDVDSAEPGFRLRHIAERAVMPPIGMLRSGGGYFGMAAPWEEMGQSGVRWVRPRPGSAENDRWGNAPRFAGDHVWPMRNSLKALKSPRTSQHDRSVVDEQAHLSVPHSKTHTPWRKSEEDWRAEDWQKPRKARPKKKTTASSDSSAAAEYGERLDSGLAAFASGAWQAARDDFAACCEMRPTDPVPPYNLCCCFTQLGEHETAMEWLGRAAACGLDLAELEEDSDLDPLRGHPGSGPALKALQAAHPPNKRVQRRRRRRRRVQMQERPWRVSRWDPTSGSGAWQYEAHPFEQLNAVSFVSGSTSFGKPLPLAPTAAEARRLARRSSSSSSSALVGASTTSAKPAAGGLSRRKKPATTPAETTRTPARSRRPKQRRARRQKPAVAAAASYTLRPTNAVADGGVGRTSLIDAATTPLCLRAPILSLRGRGRLSAAHLSLAAGAVPAVLDYLASGYLGKPPAGPVAGGPRRLGLVFGNRATGPCDRATRAHPLPSTAN